MSKPIQYIAAKAVILKDGRVLVLRQVSDITVDNANRYHPPGGIVEPGETLHQALTREVKEEAGLDINIGEVLSVEEWHVNIRGDDCYFVGIFFLCSLLGNAEIQLQAEEASAFAWASKSELEKLDIVEPSLSVLKKAFK